MKTELNLTDSERSYLRELAKKQMEYASLPVMKERERLWYEHNSLKGKKPVIVMEHDLFKDDILHEFKCQNSAARQIERNLLMNIVNHEMIDDDKVVPPYYTVLSQIEFKEFDTKIESRHAKDSSGKSLGYAVEHPIKDLQEDFGFLKPSAYHASKDDTFRWKAFVEEAIGDIMPVRVKNESLQWYATPSEKVVRLMGLERMMYSMLDYPEEMHKLYRFLTDDILSYIKWQEEEGLLTLNNENDFIGSGSYGFSRELPSESCRNGGPVTMKDIWINMNSQETVGISPQMYQEFIFPYYYELAEKFGMVYYGCCEPVHAIWESAVSKLPNLRKVSISPWCNEEFMGKALRGSNVIYSRKPSPNYIGTGSFDEDAFSKHIADTLKAAQGCHLEIIFRDIYALSGDLGKPARAIRIVRELIEELWQ